MLMESVEGGAVATYSQAAYYVVGALQPDSLIMYSRR